MKRKRLLATLAIKVCLVACNGTTTPTTTPPPPPQPSAPTRVVSLSGNLAFGDVTIGTFKEAQLTVANAGSSTLTVSGITVPIGYTSNWDGGTIPGGASLVILIRFAPTEERSYNGTVTARGDHTSGTNTIGVTGRGVRPPGPRTQFGTGLFAVGTEIAPGRYYSDPRSGCYFERLSGLGGSLNEIIANEFIGDDVGQWIIEILPSDRYFRTDAECGTWFSSPRRGLQATITPGMWLVGSQITPGIYGSNVRSGCYWERKRSFFGTLADIIDNDFVGADGPNRVEVRSSDLGFQSDAECGTWTRQTGLTSHDSPSVRDASLWRLESNRNRHRQSNGVP